MTFSISRIFRAASSAPLNTPTPTVRASAESNPSTAPLPRQPQKDATGYVIKTGTLPTKSRWLRNLFSHPPTLPTSPLPAPTLPDPKRNLNQGLPPELLIHIFNQALRDKPVNRIKTEQAISLSSKTLMYIVKDSAPHTFAPSKLRIQKFDKLVKSLAVNDIDSHMLALMGPRQRSVHIKRILVMNDRDNQSKIIAETGPSMAFFTRDQQAAMVTIACRRGSSRDDLWRTNKAISGLSTALGHLVPSQRRRLVNAACSLPATERAATIGALSSAMALLKPEQRKKMFKAARRLPDPLRAKALAGLCAGLASLTPLQQAWLINATHDLGPMKPKADALANLGSALESLTPLQREAVVGAAFQLPQPDHRDHAIAGLTQGLAFLAPLQRVRLVEGALTLLSEHSKTQAFAALGAGMALLEPLQQRTLIDAALGASPLHHNPEAIAGLSAGLASLARDQRWRLIQATTALQPGVWRQKALVTMAGQSSRLDVEQQQRVVQAVLDTPLERDLAGAIVAMNTELSLLDSPQRRVVLHAFKSLHDALPWAQAFAALASGTHE